MRKCGVSVVLRDMAPARKERNPLALYVALLRCWAAATPDLKRVQRRLEAQNL